MYLRITGKSKKLPRKQVREAARFYASKLMSSRLLRRLNVHIIFKPKLWRKEKVTGRCELALESTPRKFKIFLDAHEGYTQTLDTLAHEFVHVKQYATGELKEYVYRTDAKYRGKFFKFSETDEDAYWDSPWEIEANGREYGLRRRYVKSLDKKKKL